MGELIPYNIQRINKALTLGNWLLAGQLDKKGSAHVSVMQKSVFYYMRENVFITTSGVVDHAALNCAIAELGIDNVMFSVDDPFGDNFESIKFLNTAQLSADDMEKLAHGNAERILNLSAEAHSSNNTNQLLGPHLKSSIFNFKAKAKSKIGQMLLSFLVK